MKCCCPFKKKSQSQNRKPLPESRNRSSKSDDSAANSGIKLGRDDSEISPLSKLEMYNEEVRNLRVFSFSELRTATNNFDESQMIGEGGFGKVFRGSVMPPNEQGEPTVVAIKSLRKDGFQGHKQWLAEVKFLSIVNHPNLVKLLGHCSQGEESVNGGSGILRLLVYEFMPNKSLEDHLFSEPSATLPWKTRLEIMLGAAQGLAYLHEGLKIQVIYRDFKSSNVLLDESFKPKLSDFGLAREGPIDDQTHVTTEVFGTMGYAAPEYMDTGHLTIKSDIYSFGVVLYEILTGRRTVDKDRPPNEQKLLDWVKQYPADSERFGLIIDPRLGNKYSLTAAQKIAELANTCLARNQRDRPKMSQVVKSLRQAIEDLKEGSSDSCVIGL